MSLFKEWYIHCGDIIKFTLNRVSDGEPWGMPILDLSLLLKSPCVNALPCASVQGSGAGQSQRPG